MAYDFCGWATKNDLKCADGLTIRKNAFKVNDGTKVPLVWNHHHESVSNVLGHAMLKNKQEGVYAYCQFNDTAAGQEAKKVVRHGDIVSLSVLANNIEKNGTDVVHGVIREVSLVLAGANPGAFIESVIAHGIPIDDDDTDAVIYTGESLTFENEIAHADEEPKKEESKTASKDDDSETIGEVFDSLTDKQKTAVAIIIGQALSDKKGSEDDEKKGGDEMAHNIFDKNDKDDTQQTYLSHSDGIEIIQTAKQIGSLREAFRRKVGDDVIAHAVPMDGMTATTESKNYGVNGFDLMAPDYKNQNIPPEFISRDMGWVNTVLSGVHKLPYEKIRSMYADITEDDARAKGYIKGAQKFEEVFSILTRTTEGQMIYKLQKLDREDIMDIIDFDVVPWIKREMDIMLDEEKARAILIGDGRLSTDKYKIKEDRIRPIVKDVPLFNVRVKVKPDTAAATITYDELANATVDAVIRARKKYKGSGTPAFFTTDDVITEMLMIKDKIGHKIYKTMQELATALRVSAIIPVEPMAGYKIDNEELVGVIVNLQDYAVGQNPRAKRDMFEDFDIDFNKYTYLKEEKFSGALRKPFSALTVTLAAGYSFASSDETSDDAEETP